MSRRSRALAYEQESNACKTDDLVARVQRYRAETEQPAEEESRDNLLRDILGALNRMRLMPYPASARAEKDYNRLCKRYKALYGHLTIPTSLPLRLVRRCEPQAEEQDCKVLPFCKKNGSA